ncbi:acetate--CoA ligase family protein [bacterium]|nr:acetate--CoA ligase family protein [candidate division CSSED10-310 bacterium]
MKLYEHESKKLFEASDIPVPRQFGVIHDAAEIRSLDAQFPVMLKAMVLIGGRGKAGGIKKAGTLEEAEAVAAELLGMSLRGYPVEAVLVEEYTPGVGACYVGVTMDPTNYNNVLMVSAEGGVDIEQVAVAEPDAILRVELPGNELALPRPSAERLAGFLVRSLPPVQGLMASLVELVSSLYALYQQYDCKVCEINPLIVLDNGVIAADAKIVLDDNALYRQSDMLARLGITKTRHDVAEATANETRAREAGFIYVDLLPEHAVRETDKLYVGLVPGGAGYGIFSIDEVANIGRRYFDGKAVPVNFMDSGGGPPEWRVAEMFHLLMDYELVDIVITSRFGGISSCDVFIRGLIRCLRERYAAGRRLVPVHGRMVGTDLPSAREYLVKACAETPEPLADLHIVVGNQMIMAEVIREGLAKGFARKEGRA